MAPPQLEALYERLIGEPSDIWEHLPVLREAVMSAPPGLVVEMGVGPGRSSVALLAGCIDTGRELWSIDQMPVGGEFSSQLVDYPQWRFHYANSRDADFVNTIPQVPMVFIDTSHLYFDTLIELDLWTRKLEPGGKIWMHDTQLWAGGEQPVSKAVAHWLETAPGWTWEERTNCYGLGTLTKP